MIDQDDTRALMESLRARNLGGLARSIGACAVVATALGVILVPGVHGNAQDSIVNFWDRAAALFAYAMAILLSVGIVVAIAELVGSRRADTASGAFVVGGASLVVVLLVVAMWRARVDPGRGLPEHITLGFAIVSAGIASTSGFRSVGAPHTRAVAILLSSFALAALVRVGAWEAARIAGDRANPSLYSVSRGLATVGVLLEAAGQLAAAVWIGTRGRVGLVLSTLAAGGAFFLTWSAATGARADAPRWTAALYTSLAEASPPPAPFGLGAAAWFLLLSGALLAAAALALAEPPGAICAAVALALVSRGAFDAPLRAVAIVAASAWTFVAAFDERMMWAALRPARESHPSHPPAALAPHPPGPPPRRQGGGNVNH